MNGNTTENQKRHNTVFRLSRGLYGGLKWTGYLMTAVALVSLIGVIVYIFADGAGKMSWHLLFGAFSSDMPSILPATVGTLTLVAVASLIAVPLGVACAVFLVEYTDNTGLLVRMIRVATETLAGIPSIVYGLFGYLVFVVAFGWGYTLIGGGITLAIMVLPVIVRSTEESLLTVPAAYREGAYALGAGKVTTVFRIILPAASAGIVTSIILAVGRIISESAVLILTIGMVVNIMPVSPLSPGTSLALDIYYFASHGYPNEAAATAVVLLVLVLCLNFTAAFIGKRIKNSTGEIQ